MSTRHFLSQPWFVLLASGSSIGLVLAVIVLTGLSISVGSAIKDLVAASACAIYSKTECATAIDESATTLLIIFGLTLTVAQGIIWALCRFVIIDCDNSSDAAKL